MNVKLFTISLAIAVFSSLPLFAIPIKPSVDDVSRNATGFGNYTTDDTLVLNANLSAQALGDNCAFDVPTRPDYLDNTWHAGREFRCINNEPRWEPALDSMPSWLFARTGPHARTCYPESAVVLGSNPPMPNPGTSKPGSIDPGEDCNSPGDYHGAFSPGNPFPVYVMTRFCPAQNQWRLGFTLYYVHDGAFSEGHQNDWDSTVTIIWKQDSRGSDWWYRDSAIYHKHQWADLWTWDQLETVEPDNLTQFVVQSGGKGLRHPNVYVGLYSHAAFKMQDTVELTYVGPKTEEIANDEYRSNDWVRMPELTDIHDWTEIDRSWGYGGNGITPPYSNYDSLCKDGQVVSDSSPDRVKTRDFEAK